MVPEDQSEQAVEADEEWGLGEVVEVPESAVRAASTIVEQSMVQWNKVYEMLSIELGVEDLAAEVKLACKPSPAPAPAGETAEAAAEAAREPDHDLGWHNRDGWWLERPLAVRASAVAGLLPEPFLTFSIDCKALLDVRGKTAAGIHIVAVTSPGAQMNRVSLASADDAAAATAWAANLPERALIFVAILNVASEVASELLTAMAAGNLSVPGFPAAAPPGDCGVSVAVGWKGDRQPLQTMAAADFALASARTDRWRGG
eukprot:gnl/TRDRNA2_/TRDRNA2_133838_c0_seq1.p2 gnl/TRDRNA2_/TRDRNA2_133838_c0~~gnl/TRDRNA2_/TRDRNA2_133838_c0_seq1.p2  ORF type:complete len:259 (+),score=55.31 gnl/TRDRNA2_/TRDRNA2_133838_c0_seq1:979-1755(+)